MLRAISRALDVVRATAGSLGRDEVGTVLMYAAAIPVFAGVVAVGAETGNFYNQKRLMQNAADDAALSGSIDNLASKPLSTITADAQYEAQRNGFTNGVNNVSVTVNSPPKSGPNVGTAGAVEVIIQKSSQSFIFGNVLNTFLGQQSANPFTLTARSVAAQSTYTKTTTSTVPTYSSEGCIVALTPNAEQGISITNFNNFTSDCSIMSNGTATTQDANASIYMGSFNTATLTATAGSGVDEAAVWTRGSFYTTNNNSVYASPKLQNQTTTLNDPYSSLSAPSPGTSCTPVPSPSNNALTLSPGTYCGGLTISNVNNVYFTPGTYYIVNGDLYITSVNGVSCPNCTTSGTTILGTTFVLTQTTGNNNNIGGVKITSENNVTLNAPGIGTSEPYQGILFYQDRNAPAGTMTSSSKIFTISSLNNAKLSGAIYFPQNRIDVSSLNNFLSGTNDCTVWVGRYVKFSSFNNNHAAGCKSTFNLSLPGIPNGTTTQTSTTTATTNRVVE